MEIIRVSGTIGLFVVGLNRILRDVWKLGITQHEQWEFKLISERVTCGNPGRCSLHGKSPEFIAEQIAEHGTGPWLDCDRHYTGMCYETTYRTYAVHGQVMVDGKKTGLRVLIEETYDSAFGHPRFRLKLWLREEGDVTDETAMTGAFGLEDNGRPYVLVDDFPSEPPSYLAFTA